MGKIWRIVIRSVGILLILGGVFCSYWWFYKLGPVRRTVNPEWVASHSQREYWREVQEGIRRGWWIHGNGSDVGYYGDKLWAEWIVNHVHSQEEASCFGRFSHSNSSFRYLTNQDLGKNPDAWFDWWEKNKSKTQEQWIADGFAMQGVKVDVPPSPQQRPLLLEALGCAEQDESSGMQRAMKYNAFRFLRDSGFDPVEFALSNPSLSDEIKRGLLEYERCERLYPTAFGVGILSFGKDVDDGPIFRAPPLLSMPYQTAAYFLSLGTLVLGTCLVVWSFRRRKKLESVRPQLDITDPQ